MKTIVSVPKDHPVMQYPTTCPEGCGNMNEVWLMLAHLEEKHGWDRPKLMEWVCGMMTKEQLGA